MIQPECVTCRTARVPSPALGLCDSPRRVAARGRAVACVSRPLSGVGTARVCARPWGTALAVPRACSGAHWRRAPRAVSVVWTGGWPCSAAGARPGQMIPTITTTTTRIQRIHPHSAHPSPRRPPSASARSVLQLQQTPPRPPHATLLTPPHVVGTPLARQTSARPWRCASA